MTELVQFARFLGLTPSLSTNGTLIDRVVAENLFDSGIRKATVSLDGTKEMHDALRRRRGAFASATSGAAALVDAGIRVTLNCLLRSEIVAGLSDLYVVADGVGAEEISFTFPMYAGRMGQIPEVFDATWGSSDQLIEDIRRIARQWESKVETTVFWPRCGTPSCPAGKSIFGYNSDKELVPCVYSAYKLVGSNSINERVTAKHSMDKEVPQPQ